MLEARMRRRKNAECIQSGGTGVSAGFQPRRSLEPTKSGYATVEDIQREVPFHSGLALKI
jgi:hypothetical protein